MLHRRVRQLDFPHATNTNLLFHRDVEVCRVSALDGEQTFFRSLPKNCIEKNPQFSGDLAESARMCFCYTHCVPALRTTWYVIHTSVWVACSIVCSIQTLSLFLQDAYTTSAIVETTLPIHSAARSAPRFPPHMTSLVDVEWGWFLL